MIIGVPRERQPLEHRVGLTPSAVTRLVQEGHEVLVEQGAGAEARFSDQVYQACGARIVYDRDEVLRRPGLVCGVTALRQEDLDLLRPGMAICAFHHLAVAPAETVERLADLEATVIGYEIIRGQEGRLAVLTPISEMAGQMAVHLAAYYLQNGSGGRGVLMGNVPGVPPPTVVVLGAGTVGKTAARQALASGAHVIVLDAELIRLQRVWQELGGGVVTAVARPESLARYTRIADVVVGAVLVPGTRTPLLVTREMVQRMRTGSVIVDVSIDQGGCVETSRPTRLDQPTFVFQDVVHYCVPRMTSNVARTASRALTNAALPYVVEMARREIRGALADDGGLAQGVYLYRGRVVHEGLGELVGRPVENLAVGAGGLHRLPL